jgi:hypothetical protein
MCALANESNLVTPNAAEWRDLFGAPPTQRGAPPAANGPGLFMPVSIANWAIFCTPRHEADVENMLNAYKTVRLLFRLSSFYARAAAYVCVSIGYTGYARAQAGHPKARDFCRERSGGLSREDEECVCVRASTLQCFAFCVTLRGHTFMHATANR